MSSLHFEKRSPVDCSPNELFAWHSRPGAFRRLAPPWQAIRLPGGDPEIRDGSRVEIQLRKGPLWLSWIAEHRNVVEGHSFEDFMVSGPFSRWEHKHAFLDREGGAELHDSIQFQMPGGGLGNLLAGGSVAGDLERAFGYRHRTTVADVSLHAKFSDRPRLAVAISGASGLIGSALAAILTTGGHRVIHLVRSPTREPDTALWSPERGLENPEALEGVDAVVHLAGENIGDGRWTSSRRQRIRASRIDGTRNLVRSLAELSEPPRTFVCASAIGIYGSRGDELLDERSSPGDGFLASVCTEWEAAAAEANAFAARVPLLRFGVVVSPRGGFLPRMLPPFRAGVGGVVGSGDQSVSWISVDDAAAAAVHALLNGDVSGPVNVVSPEPVTNRELTRALGRVLRRPTVLPLPTAAVRALFGQMADETLLSSSRVEPSALQASGFVFRHERLEGALRHLLGR